MRRHYNVFNSYDSWTKKEFFACPLKLREQATCLWPFHTRERGTPQSKSSISTTTLPKSTTSLLLAVQWLATLMSLKFARTSCPWASARQSASSTWPMSRILPPWRTTSSSVTHLLSQPPCVTQTQELVTQRRVMFPGTMTLLPLMGRRSFSQS